MKTSTKIAAKIAAVALIALPLSAQAAQKILRFAGDTDMQTANIAQFPTGAYNPGNAFPVTFFVPKAQPAKSIYNTWDDPTGAALSITTSTAGVGAIYLLAASYAPPPGAVIATVSVTGSKGATYSQQLVAGTDIRDFCQNTFANTINGTTTIGAYAISDVQGGCGTGNVKTGYVTDYRIDEIQITLPAAFLKQKVTNITITPSGNGRPVIAGITLYQPGTTTTTP